MIEEMEAKMTALRERFRARMFAERAALQGIVCDLERGAGVTEHKDEIRRLAHGLSGAGGTFGFAAISSCAAELEEFVSTSPGPAELIEGCHALIHDIDRAIGFSDLGRVGSPWGGTKLAGR